LLQFQWDAPVLIILIIVTILIIMEDKMKKEAQGICTCVITVTVFPVQCNKSLLFLNSKTVYLAFVGHDNIGAHRLQYLWLIYVQIIWMSSRF